MNQQQKVKFTDQLQKNLTRNCFSQCKNIRNKQCYDICYDKYVRTVGTVSESIKELAYQKHSLIGYKGYPEHSITNAYYYDPDITYNLWHAPFAWNREYAA